MSVNTKIRYYKQIWLLEILYDTETLLDPSVKYVGGKIGTTESKINRTV